MKRASRCNVFPFLKFPDSHHGSFSILSWDIACEQAEQLYFLRGYSGLGQVQLCVCFPSFFCSVFFSPWIMSPTQINISL